VLVSRQLSDGDRTYLTRVRAHLRESVGSRAAEEATTYAEILLERGLPVLFDARHLAHVTALNLSVVASMGAAPARHYTTFRIPKRNGGSREISAPRPALKHVQLWIHTALLSALIPHEASHGFAPGRSIVTNASPHVGAELILKLDLRDFFPSISRRQVQGIFRRAGYTVPVARLLTSLTTFGGGLPQGAPTSPALANLVAYGMDARLTRIAQHRQA
jgi:RNA-directed DNA polymerase